LKRRLCGTPNRYGQFAQEKYLLVVLGFEPLIFQPVAPLNLNLGTRGK
jgi:hypothetical protein